MESLKFYKYATWGLLILNLLMLSFFIITKGGKHEGNHTPGMAAELLKLNDEQHTQFLASAQQHEQIMDRINAAQSSLLKPYFSQLTTPQKITSANTLTEIQALEKQKIEATYQHFEEVKNILTIEQLPDFKIFMNHILTRLIDTKKKNPPPPKDY